MNYSKRNQGSHQLLSCSNSKNYQKKFLGYLKKGSGVVFLTSAITIGVGEILHRKDNMSNHAMENSVTRTKISLEQGEDINIGKNLFNIPIKQNYGSSIAQVQSIKDSPNFITQILEDFRTNFLEKIDYKELLHPTVDIAEKCMKPVENPSDEQKEWQQFHLKIAENLGNGSQNYAMITCMNLTVESGWGQNTKSHSGATGIGQLTDIVFQDFIVREQKAKEIFLRIIADSEVVQFLPEYIGELQGKTMDEITTTKWKSIVNTFKKDAETNAFVNILVANMVFQIKYENEAKTAYNAGTFMAANNNITAKGASFSCFPQNKEEQRLYTTAYFYNANDAILSNGLKEKEYHMLKINDALCDKNNT